MNILQLNSYDCSALLNSSVYQQCLTALLNSSVYQHFTLHACFSSSHRRYQKFLLLALLYNNIVTNNTQCCCCCCCYCCCLHSSRQHINTSFLPCRGTTRDEKLTMTFSRFNSQCQFSMSIINKSTVVQLQCNIDINDPSTVDYSE